MKITAADIKFVNIQSKVDNAIQNLYYKDSDLFEIGVHERTIAHKFAEHLQQEFKVHKVDCEYNRDDLDIKRLDSLLSDSEEKKCSRIFPDIIIHIRKKDDFNELVIEIKTSSDPSDGDIEKLIGLTSRRLGFNYKYGLFIRFKNNIRTHHQIKPHDTLIKEMKWFKNGREFIPPALKPNKSK